MVEGLYLVPAVVVHRWRPLVADEVWMRKGFRRSDEGKGKKSAKGGKEGRRLKREEAGGKETSGWKGQGVREAVKERRQIARRARWHESKLTFCSQLSHLPGVEETRHTHHIDQSSVGKTSKVHHYPMGACLMSLSHSTLTGCCRPMSLLQTQQAVVVEWSNCNIKKRKQTALISPCSVRDGRGRWAGGRKRREQQ